MHRSFVCQAKPLLQAHALARAAAVASATSPLAAADNHHSAAAEFRRACEDVEDSEALRILRLLEAHHEKVAQIIRSRDDNTATLHEITQDTGADAVTPNVSKTSHTSTVSGSDAANTVPSKSTRRSRSPILQRRNPRESSSSIASNLATARGIPGATLRRGPTAQAGLQSIRDRAAASARHTDTGAAKTEDRVTNVSSSSARVGEPRRSQAGTQADKEAEGADDAAFHKFFNRFEGLLSTLSAPLAFAGLPLTSEEHENSQRTRSISKASSVRASITDGMDVSRLFSAASLRAARDNRSQAPSGVHESFYVVPTAGGTVSYASMLSRDDDAARRPSVALASNHEEASEQFVDAHETPQPGSPKLTRSNDVMTTRLNAKTVEELEMENASLKQNMDNLSRRLYMWERSSQSQTSALQQSIRTLKPAPSIVVPANVGDQTGNAAAAGEAKIQDLEEQVKTARHEMDKYMRENEKLKVVVTRYRERWEKLKEGARVRREGSTKGGGDGG